MLLTARDPAKARTAARRLGNLGTVEALALDVADPSSTREASAEVANRYGYLDVLVNNAGINHDTSETVENADINGTVLEAITTDLLGACCAKPAAASSKINPWNMRFMQPPRRSFFCVILDSRLSRTFRPPFPYFRIRFLQN